MRFINLPQICTNLAQIYTILPQIYINLPQIYKFSLRISQQHMPQNVAKRA